MSESTRSKSPWIVVIVVLLALGVVIAKHATKPPTKSSPAPSAPSAPAHPPSPTPTVVPESQPAAAQPATPRQPVRLSPTATTPQATTATPPPAAATPPPAPEPPQENAPLLSGAQLADALKSGRPTVADFGASWCKPCKLMEPVLKEAAKKHRGKVNIVFVDTDAYPALAKSYRIGPIPAQVFLDAEGKEVGRHIGYYPLPEFETDMRRFKVIE